MSVEPFNLLPSFSSAAKRSCSSLRYSSNQASSAYAMPEHPSSSSSGAIEYGRFPSFNSASSMTFGNEVYVRVIRLIRFTARHFRFLAFICCLKCFLLVNTDLHVPTVYGHKQLNNTSTTLRDVRKAC